jgi:threonine dehydrogenase-like Zn-dependent dehydrogenase
MENGTVNLAPLITHEFLLEESDKAFKMVHNNNEFYVKAMFMPGTV